MKTCIFNRNHGREHSGLYRDNEMLYAMKGYDEAQGLACLLDGNWGGSLDHSWELGCHFGYNSFLDYGAEFMCSEFSPIREIRTFSGFREKKSADADWNWVLFQQQASLNNSSTLLVSKDGFEGSMAMMLKGDVKAAPECAASKMPLCPHARRNRPRRVNMIPSVDSNAASVSSRKESVLYCSAKGRECAIALPSKTFSTQNEDWVAKGQDAASRLISALSPPCADKLCLASLLCDDKMLPSFLDLWPSPLGLTDLTDSQESHLDAIQPSLLEPVSSYTNRLNDINVELKVSEKGCFDVTDQEIEILGKALCHAQTRARLAEKLAAQTLQERDRLEQLLIREAWTTYTYRQRALALELENRLLKVCSKLKPAEREKAYIRMSVEQKTRDTWKLARQQHPHQNRKEVHISKSSQGKKRMSKPRRHVSLPCTIGFAFVLGLSIAGTGIVIVWSFGWMFF